MVEDMIYSLMRVWKWASRWNDPDHLDLMMSGSGEANGLNSIVTSQAQHVLASFDPKKEFPVSRVIPCKIASYDINEQRSADQGSQVDDLSYLGQCDQPSHTTSRLVYGDTAASTTVLANPIRTRISSIMYTNNVACDSGSVPESVCLFVAPQSNVLHYDRSEWESNKDENGYNNVRLKMSGELTLFSPPAYITPEVECSPVYPECIGVN